MAKAQQDSALVLSAQLTKSADDQRNLVKTTADEQSRNLQQQFTGIASQLAAMSTRLTALEQAGAEGLGKQKLQDPAITALETEVGKLSRLQADAAGAGAGQTSMMMVIFLSIGAIVGIGGLIVVLVRKPATDPALLAALQAFGATQLKR